MVETHDTIGEAPSRAPLYRDQVDDIVSDRIVEVMNRAIAADPEAVEALLHVRILCNDVLAGDPTIQAASGSRVGVPGLLCGIAGAHPDGYAKIAAKYETVCPTHGAVDTLVGRMCPEDGCGWLVERGRLLRFVKTRAQAVADCGVRG